MLIRTHMEELKDDTNHIHYENYRIEKLAETGGVKEEKNEGPAANMYNHLFNLVLHCPNLNKNDNHTNKRWQRWKTK